MSFKSCTERWITFFYIISMKKIDLVRAHQLLDKVKNYFARVEFQNRGSPHMHMFSGLKAFPLLLNVQTQILTDYIDKVVFTIIDTLPLPLQKLAWSLQMHRHASYCLKANGNCFRLPFKTCSETALKWRWHSFKAWIFFYKLAILQMIVSPCFQPHHSSTLASRHGHPANELCRVLLTISVLVFVSQNLMRWRQPCLSSLQTWFILCNNLPSTRKCCLLGIVFWRTAATVWNVAIKWC